MAVILGLIAGPLLGSAGSFFGSQQAAGGQPQTGSLPASGFTPFGDSLFNALQEQLLLDIGSPRVADALRRGSPLEQARNAIASGTAGDLRREDVERFAIGVREAQPVIQLMSQGISFDEAVNQYEQQVRQQVRERLGENVPEARVNRVADREVLQTLRVFRPETTIGRVFNQFAQATGFESAQDLLTQEGQFRLNLPEQQRSALNLADQIQASREGVRQQITELQQAFPSAERLAEATLSPQELDALAGTFAEDIRRQRVAEANRFGFNPSLRNIERESFQRALELGQGRQALELGNLGLLVDTLAGLQSSLASPTQLAIQGAGTLLPAQTTAAQIAAQQAIALGQIGAAADARAAEARGQGIQGLFGGIGDAFTLGALGGSGFFGPGPGAEGGAGFNPFDIGEDPTSGVSDLDLRARGFQS